MYQVLIVEDEDWIRRGIVQSIRWRELGMELAGEAENGARALQILERRPVDIVLTDMKMPVCDGRGLLREMKDRKLDCEYRLRIYPSGDPRPRSRVSAQAH